MEGNLQKTAGAIPKGSVKVPKPLSPEVSPLGGEPLKIFQSTIKPSSRQSDDFPVGTDQVGEPSQPQSLLGAPPPGLEQVIADLESLSYSLSHSLRAPLRSIHGFAQLMLQDYREKVGAGGQDYLQRIMTAALHMDELVQQVLAFHQLVYTPFKLERLELKQVVERLLKFQPERTLPILQVQVPETLPAVLGNELALKLCLSNWLICLTRYYPPNLSPRLRLWAERKESRVRLWLSSLNSDLSLEDAQLLRSACLSAGKTGQITDLGLAVIRKAGQAMNGRTGMEFVCGQGVQFWLELAAVALP